MELVERKEESKEENVRSSMKQALHERLLKRREEGKSNRSTRELFEERRKRLKSLTTTTTTTPPPPSDEENPFIKEEETVEKSLVRKQDHLVAGDLVTATVASTMTLSVVAFQVLCLSDQQCLSTEDPAVSSYTQCVIPLVVIVLVAFSLSAYKIRACLATSAALFFAFFALSLERDDALRAAHFRRTARRSWRECDETESNGVWQFGSGCDYPNSARVYYNTHENLAEQMRRNLEHVFYVTLAMTVNFGLATFASAYVLLFDNERDANDDACCRGGELGDCLRLRPRLVKR